MAEDRPVSTVNSDYATPTHSPLNLDNGTLEPPRASFFNPGLSPDLGNTPRDSIAASTSGPEQSRDGLTPAESTTFLPAGKESETALPQRPNTTKPLYRRPAYLAVAVAALVAIILTIVLPVYFVVIRKNNDSSKLANGNGSGSGSGSGNGKNPPSSSNATTGGNGSTIVSGNTSFIYNNPFGGYWIYDPQDPFNDGAAPNSWTPPLNTTWDWVKDRVYGVNLGGLFVLEPFISPAIFQKYPTAIDEWTLSLAMTADTGPGGGLQPQLEAHYDTFITEQDIADIAGAGLNWIRLPIPYWAINTWPGEPFLAQVSWKYILRIFGWARKYGLRICLDLHTVPGSQNGYNHSGKQGQINFLDGFMGLANAQRTLDYIRIITEFISQPEYRNLIPMFGIVNEALITSIGQAELSSFYLQAHGMIRNITGFGVGNGPYIIIHDGFAGLAYWADFLPGSDRIALDTHPYFSFDGQPNTAPLDVDDGTGEPGGVWPLQACNAFGPPMNVSQTAFGVSIAGEFSSAINDCGLYVLGIGNAATYPGNCTTFTDWQNWNSTFKEGLLDYTLASMDSLQNWFFWTWKIGNSSTSGTVEAPVWSYQLGLQNGWLPTDPRVATGKCRALGGTQELFAGTYSAWQTGGPGAGTIAPIETVSFPWPPTTLNDVEGAIYAALPTYTPTGTIPTLPPPQLTPSVSQENGWYDAQDTAGVMTPISGCTYPNAWDSVGVVAPTVPCPARALPVVPTVPTVLVPTVLTTPTPIPVTPIITTTIPPTIVTPAPVAPIA